ncbi:AAA family ATPase [Dermabacteraceae bacterium P9123]
MLSKLDIKRFKRFRDASLRFRNLTILTGQNSAGKSTVLQSLLLSRKSLLSQTQHISLNDKGGLALGTFFDAFNFASGADGDDIYFGLHFSGGDFVEVSISEDPSMGDEGASAIAKTKTFLSQNSSQKNVNEFFSRKENFIYLCAERIGPRDIQEISSKFDIGVKGEHSAYYILSRSQLDVDDTMLKTEGEGAVRTFKAQLEEWLSALVSPVQIDTKCLPGTNSAVIHFRPTALEYGLLAEWLRSSNVGFGFSYALPIVAAGLSLEKGSLLVVENPEAHLHPKGQSEMGAFLSRVAARGVQVIVETHSDHVINGIRKATALDGVLKTEEAVFYYFSPQNIFEEIEILPDGSLDHWPEGFFDQFENDLLEITRARYKGF